MRFHFAGGFGIWAKGFQSRDRRFMFWYFTVLTATESDDKYLYIQVQVSSFRFVYILWTVSHVTESLGIQVSLYWRKLSLKTNI